MLYLFSGCVDNSYRGLVDIDYDYDPSVPIPIWIQIGEPSKTKLESWAQSKAVGVIEENKSFMNTPIYIYAFNQDKLTEMTATNEENPDRCLIDATIDYAQEGFEPLHFAESYHPLGGRQAWYDTEKQLVTWYKPRGPVYNEDLYWPMGDSKPNRYDFFAYYIDDIVPKSVIRYPSSIVLEIEIDGNQDVMSAVALPSEDKLKAIFPKEEDYLKMIEYKYFYCYGYYSALKTLNPEFVFDHHLVRLDFFITPGETKGYTNTITLHDITVSSKYKAEFTVASTNVDKDTGSGLGLAFDGTTRKVMHLCWPDGSPYNESGNFHTFSTDNTGPAAKFQAGGSFLVAPTSDIDVGGIGYEITVTLSEVRTYPPSEEFPEGRTVAYPEYTNKLYLKNPSLNPTSDIPRPFQAGNLYQVNMTVHGHNDITLTTDLKSWDDVGDGETDTDKRPGGRSKDQTSGNI